MRVGTRVVYPEEVGRWEADLVQISVYRGHRGNLHRMRQCAAECRKRGLSFVVHPVGYSLLEEEPEDLREMAQCADLALILHDERNVRGGRLEGPEEARFLEALGRLRALARISFENATSTEDVVWFWDRFADSITLDIGHVESAGLNSVEFVKELPEDIVHRIEFVHMHRNADLRGGITDHWPPTPYCREVLALRHLLRRKRNVSVLLEVNEMEMIGQSLKLIRGLRQELKTK